MSNFALFLVTASTIIFPIVAALVLAELLAPHSICTDDHVLESLTPVYQIRTYYYSLINS